VYRKTLKVMYEVVEIAGCIPPETTDGAILYADAGESDAKARNAY